MCVCVHTKCTHLAAYTMVSKGLAAYTKAGKSHIIGEELILPAISEVIQTVFHMPAFNIIKKISLSNSTVQRRIDEMAQSVEESLCEYFKTSSLYSLMSQHCQEMKHYF